MSLQLFYRIFSFGLFLVPLSTSFAHFPSNCSIVIQENIARGQRLALPFTNTLVAFKDQFDLQVTNTNPYFGVVSEPPGLAVSASNQETPWRIWYPKDPPPLTGSPWFLVTLQRIDRERLCETEPGCDCHSGSSHPSRLGGGPDCIIPLRLVAISSKKVGLPTVIDLRICIADENDNPPSFRPSLSAPHFGSTPSVNIYFKEDAQIGQMSSLPSAHDPDAYPEHTVTSYALNCPESDVPFSLIYDISSPDKLDLRVDKDLNFDRQ